LISSKTLHDDFFKLIFGKKEEVALSHFLKINTSSLTLLSKEKNYKKLFLNLTFRANYKNKNAQIVFKHKSYPDNRIYFQILSYAMSIWQKAKENLTPIIPIIFYQRKQNFELKDNFNKLFSIQTLYNLNLAFKTFNINKIDNKITYQNLFLCATIFTMKYIFESIENLKKLSYFYSKISKDNYFLIVKYISVSKHEKRINTKVFNSKGE